VSHGTGLGNSNLSKLKTGTGPIKNKAILLSGFYEKFGLYIVFK